MYETTVTLQGNLGTEVTSRVAGDSVARSRPRDGPTGSLLGGRLSGLAQLARERLQEGPGHRRVALHQRLEVPQRDSLADEFAVSGHRGCAGSPIDECDLAEVVP